MTGSASARGDARVSIGLARAVVAAARARGIATDEDLAKVDLSESDLDQVDGRVSYRTLMDLLGLFAERSGDSSFGLRTAEAFVDAASFGVVGFAARSSASLREAIERTARYARLMNENTVISVTYDSLGARIVDGPLPPLVWPRHYAEMALAAFVTLGRKWTGTHFDAVAVGFVHAAPVDVREHVAVFGCKPTFGEDHNYVVIPAAALDRCLAHGDQLLGRYFDRRLDELADAMSAAPGPLADVRDVMIRTLPQGAPTLASVSHALAVSERTLQRRLKERGVTFHAILDSVRRDAALTAIGQPQTSVQEIAFLCGFADLKAFRRAFQRWTGRSPAQYRSQR